MNIMWFIHFRMYFILEIYERLADVTMRRFKGTVVDLIKYSFTLLRRVFYRDNQFRYNQRYKQHLVSNLRKF